MIAASSSPPMTDYKYSTMTSSYCGVKDVSDVKVKGVSGVSDVSDVNHQTSRGRSNTMMTSLTSSTSSVIQQQQLQQLQKETATQQQSRNISLNNSFNAKSSSISLPSCRRRLSESCSLDHHNTNSNTNGNSSKPSASGSKSICSCSSQPLPTPSSNALPSSSLVIPITTTSAGTSKIQHHNTSTNASNDDNAKFKTIEIIKNNGKNHSDNKHNNNNNGYDSNLIHSPSKSEVVLPKASSSLQQQHNHDHQQQEQLLLSTPIASNVHVHNDHTQIKNPTTSTLAVPPQDLTKNIFSKKEGTTLTPSSKKYHNTSSSNNNNKDNNGLILIRSRISREDLIKEDAFYSDHDGYVDNDDYNNYDDDDYDDYDSSHDSTTTRIIRQRIRSNRNRKNNIKGGRGRSQSTSVVDSMLDGSSAHYNNNDKSITPLSKSWNALHDNNTQSLLQQNNQYRQDNTTTKTHHRRLTHPNDSNNNNNNFINNNGTSSTNLPLYKQYDQDFMIHSKRFIETNLSPTVRPTYTIHRNVHISNNDDDDEDDDDDDDDDDEYNYNNKFVNEATGRNQNRFGHSFINESPRCATDKRTTGIHHSTNQITTTASKRRSRKNSRCQHMKNQSDVNFLGKIIVCQMNDDDVHDNGNNDDGNDIDDEYGSITSSSFTDDILMDHQDIDQGHHVHNFNNGMMKDNVHDWEMLKSDNVPMTTTTSAVTTAAHVTSKITSTTTDIQASSSCIYDYQNRHPHNDDNDEEKKTELEDHKEGLLLNEDEDDEINTNERNYQFVKDKRVTSICSTAAAVAAVTAVVPLTSPSCPLEQTTEMVLTSMKNESTTTTFHMDRKVAIEEEDLDEQQREVQFSFLEDGI